MIFTEWFEKLFVERVKHTNEPKLLILDGHSFHMSLNLIEIANQNNIRR